MFRLNRYASEVLYVDSSDRFYMRMALTKIGLIILIGLLVFSSEAFAASCVNVPLDHWSYQFLEQLQIKGALRKFLSNTKPYSRGKVAEMIIYALRLLEDEKISLTDVEIELLGELRKEFAEELDALGFPVAQKHKHLLDWKDDDRSLIAEIGFSQDIAMSSGPHKSTLAFMFYGDMASNLSFYNYSKASYEAGSEEPPSWKRNDPRYLFRYPWSALSDAYIVFGKPNLNLQFGKDTVRWGPGYHGVIGLYSVEPTFDLVRLRAKMWKLNFVSVLGFLRDDLNKEHRSDVPKKYLSAHRLEIVPYPGICIGWQEVYIYAEQLHMQLLNPIMPYQMTEDYLGDVGNNTMEGDIEIALIPNMKVYTALFLDDFHPKYSPFRYPGFKWAILGGIMIAVPFGSNDANIVLEYARVEPWTYTHRGVNQDPPMPTAYKHFNEPLGHWIGPNSDDLFIQMGWQFMKNMRADVSFNRIRHGEVGGSIYYAYRSDVDGQEKRFLGGIVEDTKNISFGLKYATFHGAEAGISYSHIVTKNKQKDREITQVWTPGWNTTENEFRITMQFSR